MKRVVQLVTSVFVLFLLFSCTEEETKQTDVLSISLAESIETADFPVDQQKVNFQVKVADYMAFKEIIEMTGLDFEETSDSSLYTISISSMDQFNSFANNFMYDSTAVAGYYIVNCPDYNEYIIPTTTEAHQTRYGCGIATFKGLIYCCLTDHNEDNYLGLQMSDNYNPVDGGIWWSTYTKFGTAGSSGGVAAKSNEGPKLYSDGTRLWLSWRSAKRNRLYMMSATDPQNTWGPEGSARRVKYRGVYQNSDFPPSLVKFQGNYFLAWTGRKDRYIMLMRGTLDNTGTKIKWNYKKKFKPASIRARSNVSPHLVATDDFLYLVWTGRDNKIRIMRSQNGLWWIEKTKYGSLKSKFGPDMQYLNGKMYLAFTEDVGNSEIYVYEGTIGDWGAITWRRYCEYPVGFNSRPSLVVHNNDLIMAWKYWDNVDFLQTMKLR